MEGESTRSINRQISRFGVLSSFTRTQPDSPSITTVSSSSIGILRPFLLFPRRSPLPVFGLDGETLLSGSHVKDTRTQLSFNRPEVIVFVKQSDSIADVSIQRRSSPFDPSTSSSQSSRLSQMSCFRADKSIARRLLSTCLVLGEILCAKRHSQSAKQTCPITAEAVSSH